MSKKVLKLIDSVLSGEVEEVDLKLLITLADADSYILSNECIEDDDEGYMATNGWQWDFWKYYLRERDNQGFTLSGSGYYGSLEFRKGGKQ